VLFKYFTHKKDEQKGQALRVGKVSENDKDITEKCKGQNVKKSEFTRNIFYRELYY